MLLLKLLAPKIFSKQDPRKLNQALTLRLSEVKYSTLLIGLIKPIENSGEQTLMTEEGL